MALQTWTIIARNGTQCLTWFSGQQKCESDRLILHAFCSSHCENSNCKCHYECQKLHWHAFQKMPKPQSKQAIKCGVWQTVLEMTISKLPTLMCSTIGNVISELHQSICQHCFYPRQVCSMWHNQLSTRQCSSQLFQSICALNNRSMQHVLWLCNVHAQPPSNWFACAITIHVLFQLFPHQLTHCVDGRRMPLLLFWHLNAWVSYLPGDLVIWISKLWQAMDLCCLLHWYLYWALGSKHKIKTRVFLHCFLLNPFAKKKMLMSTTLALVCFHLFGVKHEVLEVDIGWC